MHTQLKHFGIIIALVALAAVFSACIQYPQDFAAADAIRIVAEVTKAAANAQATRYQIETEATATVARARVEAKMTAVPQDVQVESSNEQARNTSLTFGLIGALICGILLALGARLWVNRKARTVSRDATGQLPALLNSAMDEVVNTQAVPAFGFSKPSTAETPAIPARVIGLDDQDHVLGAFVRALAPTYAAALMSGQRTEAERKQRIQIVREAATRGPDGTVVAPATITVVGDGAVAGLLAEKMNVQLPASSDAKALPTVPQYQMLGAAETDDVVPPPEPLEFDEIQDRQT